MTRIQARDHDSDDDRQWEDLPDDKWKPHSRSPSSTPSGSFKGTASAARTRRTTRQRALYATTSPRKHIPSDHRTPVRARRERGFAVELPPQDLGTEGPEHDFPIKLPLQEPIGTVPQCSFAVELPTQQSMGTPGLRLGSPIKPLFQESMGYPVSQRSSRIEQPPQRLFGAPVPQRGSIAELPSEEPKKPVGTLGLELRNALTASFVPVLYYIAEVLGTVIRMMKFPFSIALVVMICAYALSVMSDAVTSALAPICSIPVLSLVCITSKSSVLPRPPNPDRTPRWADFPSLLNVESNTFESLLDETVKGPGLALEIKKAEMATSDLVTLVRVSNLNSREILADSLSEFVKDARKVGRGLTRFSSKVGGTVDSIIAVNDYALHRIEAAGSRPSGLSLRRLWSSSSEASLKQVITRTFTEAMEALSANMQRLVLEAEVSISDLNNLEEHLKSIHEVVSREDSSISAAKDELLAQLWSILGGNRKQLNGMDKHLALLKGVGGYRDRARAHVVAALQVLETMAEEMEELRERVAAPELVGDAIPIDVHMKSIKIGLERLKERRIGAKHLEEQLRNQVLGSGDGDGVKVTRA